VSRSHRSLKLLNHASSSVDNKLELYTELDNTFLPGDLLWITGGYYDNTDEMLYFEAWTNGNNVFNALGKKPYKVLSINALNNSFTVDISTLPTLFYPYCTKANTTNITANPFDIVDLAYNNINTTGSVYDMYKGVYVSQYVAPKSRVVAGTVYNGTFGTDVTTVNFGINATPGILSLKEISEDVL
jgi:hypothetical protein